MSKRKIGDEVILPETKKINFLENHKFETIYFILIESIESDHKLLEKLDKWKPENFVPSLWIFYLTGNKEVQSKLKKAITFKKQECEHIAKNHMGMNLLMIKWGFSTILNILHPLDLYCGKSSREDGNGYNLKKILPYVLEKVETISFYNFDSMRNFDFRDNSIIILLTSMKCLKKICMCPNEETKSLRINYKKIFKDVKFQEFHLNLSGLNEIPKGMESLVTHLITNEELSEKTKILQKVIYWKPDFDEGVSFDISDSKFMPNLQEIDALCDDFPINISKKNAHKIEKARGYIRQNLEYFTGLKVYKALRIKPKDVKLLPSLEKLEIDQILKKDVEQIKKDFPRLEIGHLSSCWMYGDDIFTCNWHFVTPIEEQWNSPETDEWLRQNHAEYYNGNHKNSRSYLSHSYKIDRE